MVLLFISLYEKLDGEAISFKAKAADAACAFGGDVGVLSEIFSCEDVGDVDFYGWDVNCGNSICEGDAGVGVGSGIDDDAIGLSFALVEVVDKFSFYIALVGLQGYAGILIGE